MKILSLTQPWAHAVVYLKKTIENRKWSTKYRGPFLIHAAKRMTHEDYAWAERTIALETVRLEPRAFAIPLVPAPHALDRGGVIGWAKIVDVIPPCGPTTWPCTCRHAWHMAEQYGFVLADVHPLPFAPWRGALGLRDAPPELLEAIKAAERAAHPLITVVQSS